MGSLVAITDQRGWLVALDRGYAAIQQGGMAERTNARLLKSRGTSVPVGSNPTPSACQISPL